MKYGDCESIAVMHKNNYKLSWISWSILVSVGVANGAGEVNKEDGKCNHPPVPSAATYVNVTGGWGESEWVVRYICDTGEHVSFYLQNDKINSSISLMCDALLVKFVGFAMRDCNATPDL